MAQCDGRSLDIRGRVVILAAGALCTPVLLINSSSDRWPRGVGNDNDLVGRGLMFHASDFVALWPRVKANSAGPAKALSSRAFYVVEGNKHGGLQSLGLRVTSFTVYEFLYGRYGRYVPFRAPPVRFALKVVTSIIARCFREATLFATIVEDFPYWENRVYPDPTGGEEAAPLLNMSGQFCNDAPPPSLAACASSAFFPHRFRNSQFWASIRNLSFWLRSDDQAFSIRKIRFMALGTFMLWTRHFSRQAAAPIPALP